MFTGLVEGTGIVERLLTSGVGARLTVNAPFLTGGAQLGDSISVNGACLTVVEMRGSMFTFDVSLETLSSTTLGGLARGERGNLERALRLTDRLGGHLVTGHVDGKGRLVKREPSGSSVVLSIEVGAGLIPYLVAKGSVALDGISLTVNRCRGKVFELNIIPHTFEKTTLNQKKVGDELNIETDLIGKYVARLLAARSESPESGAKPNEKDINIEFLGKHGFL